MAGSLEKIVFGEYDGLEDGEGCVLAEIVLIQAGFPAELLKSFLQSPALFRGYLREEDGALTVFCDSHAVSSDFDFPPVFDRV